MKMALFKNFKKATCLHNPEGPLSDRMPPAAIYSANKEVQDLVIKGDHSNSSSHIVNGDRISAIQKKRKLELQIGQQNLVSLIR